MTTIEKANIDWANLGFGYYKTDKRYVSNYKDGVWDEGTLVDDENIVMNESAGVLQYAQTCFEGMKAYTTVDGKVVVFRPDMNAKRMADTCKRLEMPVFPEERFVDAVLNDKPTPTTGLDGLNSILVALAAKKSVAEGRPVKVSEIY